MLADGHNEDVQGVRCLLFLIHHVLGLAAAVKETLPVEPRLFCTRVIQSVFGWNEGEMRMEGVQPVQTVYQRANGEGMICRENL